MPLRRKVLLLCLMGICVAASASDTDSAIRLYADIAPRPVAEALAAFGRQTGLQLIYVSTIAETQQSRGTRAGLTASEALAQLLEGTGLRFEFLNARTVRIFAAPTVAPTSAASSSAPQHSAQRTPSGTLALDEVIVTARRHEEALNKVPINMVVWSQEDLQAAGIKGIDELASLTPSMQLDTLTDIGPSAITVLSLRGVWDRSTSMIGLYLDDTPIPPIRGYSYLRSIPPTFDVDRVEVLKGPQLQLFGEGNQGGAIRFILNQPSLSTFTAVAESEVATTEHGDMSYDTGAAFGGPMIGDVLGFRVSAWHRSEGGFVDRVDPFSGAPVDRNANRVSHTSVRGALTFAPTETVRMKASLTYTSHNLHDTPVFWTSISNVDHARLRTGSLLREPFDDAFYLGALNVTASLGGAMDLSAVTSYFHRNTDQLLDYGVNYDWGSPLGPGYPVSYSDATGDLHIERQATFMQELRLSSADRSATLTWDAGVFYSNEPFRDEAQITGAQGLPGELPGPLRLSQVSVSSQDRFAALGEVSLRVTKRLTLSTGLRSEHTHYNGVTEIAPILRLAGADSAMLPRFTLSYQANERELIYLTAAKGYGTGGLYWVFADPAAGAQGQMDTDTLWSYEAGTKSSFQDGRVQLDTGIFHIAWNNSGPGYPVPVQGFNEHRGNPGAAASNGFDVTLKALAGPHLKMHFSLAYTDLRYTRTSAPDGALVARQGDAVGELPFVVSPWNVSAAVEYSAALSHGATATLRADDVFRSRNPGPFAAEDPSSVNYLPGVTPDPSTNLISLRAAVQWTSYETSFFVNNVLNAHPILLRNINSYGYPLFIAQTFRPRTIGLSAAWRF